MTAKGPAWRTGRHGVSILVRVTPKSARDSVEGLIETPEGQALKVRVRAVAEKGQANAAVEMVVARWLGIAPSRVSVAFGRQSRVKTLNIDGAPKDLAGLMSARLSAHQLVKAPNT